MRILRVLLLASGVGLAGVVAAASQGANPVAPAPSAETLATAKELVALMSGDMMTDLTSKMAAQVWPNIEQSLRTQFPKIDAPTITELRAELEKQMAANVAESMNDAPAVYARYLTVPEMRDILAFYRTTTGAKTLKLMPQITSEVMGNFMPRMQGMMTRIDTALTAILTKHGFAPK